MNEQMSDLTDLAKRYQPLVDSYAMGDSPELADELLALIIAGKKTATCGSLSDLEREAYPMPKVGDYYVIRDGQNRPAIITQTTQVTICRFDEVDEAFARDEGEGDLSYAYWREGHQSYFERNGGFSLDMKLICERFRLVEILDR